MALADFLQALLRQPGGPQNALAQAASDQGSAGPNGSAAYQNALQAAFQAQGAPQQPAQGVSPQTTGSIAPAPQGAPTPPPVVSAPGSGGGGLSGLFTGLQSLFNPQAAARNQTADWLQRQGMDAGTATLVAGNKPLLNQYLASRMQGNKPDLQVQSIYDDKGNEQKVLLDKNTGQYHPIGGAKSDLLSPDVEAQKIRIAKESRPETNINLPGQPNIGAIPAGWAATQDPATGKWSMAPIQGGPADTSQTDAAKAGGQATKSDVITNAYKAASDLVGGTTTGIVGQGLGVIPPSDAAELRRQVAVLKSNATIESLNAMRAQSKTGGALGNVTEKEGAMLAASAGALDPNASPAQFKAGLDNYYHTLLRIVNGPEAGDKIFNETAKGGPGSSNAPKQINSEEDYVLLPRGAQYIAPDGSIRRKR